MAKFVLKGVYCSIGGTSLGDHLKQITVDDGVEEVPGEAMGDSARFFLASTLKVQRLQLEFFQDFAAANVHAKLVAAVGVSTAIIIKPTSAATGATNPRWYGNMLAPSYQPLGGSMGDAAMTSVTFVPADGTGMQWSSSD